MLVQMRLSVLVGVLLLPSSALAQNVGSPLLGSIANRCQELEATLRSDVMDDEGITVGGHVDLDFELDNRPQGSRAPANCTIQPAAEGPGITLIHSGTHAFRTDGSFGSCSRSIPGVVHASDVGIIEFELNRENGAPLAVRCEFLGQPNICDHLTFAELQRFLAPRLALELGATPFGGCAHRDFRLLGHFSGRTKGDDEHDHRGRSSDRREEAPPAEDAPAPAPAPRRERRDPPRAADERCEAGGA